MTTSSPHDLLKKGTLLHYDYVWGHERNKAVAENRPLTSVNAKKPRTACVMAVRHRGGYTHIALLSVSSQPPHPEQRAIEIPETEIRRAGLSPSRPAWITVSEYNYDIVELSYVFNPNQTPRGRFSLHFLERVVKAAGPHLFRPGARINRR
ncbi:MAG: hypothetical protein M9924_22090 [Rhizobiaceae bacterium]|nr:hypothetical protein [Rhizobiaceae bacterium]